MMSTLIEFSCDFSTMLRRKHLEEEQKFGCQVHHLVNMVTAIQNALKQRRSVQLQYTATNKQIVDKDTALEKANKNLKPPVVTDKIRDGRSHLEQRADLEKKVLEECTQRLLRDAEKYKPILKIVLKDAFLEYARIQLAYNDRIKKAFEQLVPYLDDSEITHSGPAATVPHMGDDATTPPFTSPVIEQTVAATTAEEEPDATIDDDEIVVEDLDGSGRNMNSTAKIPDVQQV
jgi:hypothetical protein